MNKIIVLIVLGLSASVFAQTSELACTFSDLSRSAKLYITVDDLRGDNIGLNYDHYKDFEGEAAAFSYKGEDLEWLWMLSLSWDGQHVEKDNKGNAEFSLDSDGCDTGKIKLYKNSSYKYGYLFVEHNCSGDVPPTFSKVVCKISEK